MQFQPNMKTCCEGEFSEEHVRIAEWVLSSERWHFSHGIMSYKSEIMRDIYAFIT